MIDPDNWESLDIMVDLMVPAGKSDAVVRHLEINAERHRESYWAHRALAHALFLIHDYGRSANEYDEALQNFPEGRPEDWMKSGEALFQASKYTDAKAHWQHIAGSSDPGMASLARRRMSNVEERLIGVSVRHPQVSIWDGEDYLQQRTP